LALPRPPLVAFFFGSFFFFTWDLRFTILPPFLLSTFALGFFCAAADIPRRPATFAPRFKEERFAVALAFCFPFDLAVVVVFVVAFFTGARFLAFAT